MNLQSPKEDLKMGDLNLNSLDVSSQHSKVDLKSDTIKLFRDDRVPTLSSRTFRENKFITKQT